MSKTINSTFDNPGGFTAESINLFGDAMDALIYRARVEPPFSADLQHALEPMLRSATTVRESMVQIAHGQLEAASEGTKLVWDQGLRVVGARDMLHAAILASKGSTTAETTPTPRITRDSGEQLIPGVDITKEILKKLVDLLPIPDTFKDLIKCIIKLICKFLEGAEQPQS